MEINAQDDFMFTAQNSLRGAKEKIKMFKYKEEKNRNIYHETVKIFGYKEKDKYYDENGLFFKMLLGFFNEVEKQMPKLDAKRVFDYQNRFLGRKPDTSSTSNNSINRVNLSGNSINAIISTIKNNINTNYGITLYNFIKNLRNKQSNNSGISLDDLHSIFQEMRINIFLNDLSVLFNVLNGNEN